MKALAAIKDFFGFRSEEFRGTDDDGKPLTGMQDFARELKQLSFEEKQELGRGAAEALGKEFEPEEKPV